MKLCKDCQHFRQGNQYHQCYRHGFTIEPLFGKSVPIHPLDAQQERDYSCGKEAKYFLKNEQSI